MSCLAIHTAYQPGDNWHCPACGSKLQLFIEEPALGVTEGCELLHRADEIRCSACDWGHDGAHLADLLMEEANQIMCPTCKGKGTICKSQPPGLG